MRAARARAQNTLNYQLGDEKCLGARARRGARAAGLPPARGGARRHRGERRGPGPRGTVAHGVGYTQESFINKEKALPVYGLHLDAQLHQQFLHLVGDRAPLPQPHRLVGVSHRPGERERLVEPKL